MRNYYSEIKPVLNKLSELNVLDSLKIIRQYINAYAHNNSKLLISGVNKPEYNSVEIYFADFLIVNIIRYSQESSAKKSLKDVNTRHAICSPINDLQNKVNKERIEKEPFIWLNSYIFNQDNMQLRINPLIIFYRYYYLYNTPNIRELAEEIFKFPLESYFKATFFIFGLFEGRHFSYKEKALFPIDYPQSDHTFEAIKYILNDISRSLPELRALCKKYCNFDEDKIFNYYSDSPHIRFPLIKHDETYFCVVPNYIICAALEGLYYKLDWNNRTELTNKEEIGLEFSSNFEKYVGLIFDYYFKCSNICYQSELTYKIGKSEAKTSDWIIWDENNICFIDCKAKRITVEGKRALEIDNHLIEVVLQQKPFSNKRRKDVIEKGMPDGLTKDLIELGIGLGKIYVSYDDYRNDRITGFSYMGDKTFHAFILTLEDNFCNIYDIKDAIMKVAQCYRDEKSFSTNIIKDEEVRFISIKDIEEDTPTVAKLGIANFLEVEKRNEIEKYWVKNDFLIGKANSELIDDMIEEMSKYKWRSDAQQ